MQARSHRSAAGELVGTFDRYDHRWPRDDQVTETIIGSISEELADGSFLTSTIKGTQQLGSLVAGLTYRFWGRYTQHDKYGEQFWFESFIEQAPVTREAICLYLAQVDGIGPVGADMAYRLWGQDAVEMFREQPDEVAAKLPRFTPEQATAGAEMLKKKQRTEIGKMSLMALVHKCGVPKRIVDKALDEWGVNAAEIIQADPFILMRVFSGIGFLKCDRMYLDFGHDPTSMHRQALACWYSIVRDNDGHTWFPRGVAKSFLNQHIAGTKVDFEAAIQYAVDHGVLQVREIPQGVFIAEPKRADAEKRVARLIEEARLELRENGTAWPDVDQIEGLSDHQRDELRKATTGVVAVLAGSPGGGKTFVAAAVIKTIRELYPTALVAAAAPTGKAAVRLIESLEKCGVTLTAKTVHSTLGVKTGEDGGFGFQHDQKNPLRLKFLLIDEFSMVDTPLAASLLAARGIGTHYLCLGDPNQLSPVGYGAPLRDMLRCPESIPAGTLTEIRRNSGRIVQSCADIRDRKPWQPSPKLDIDAGENLLLVNAGTPSAQLETLERLIRSFRDKPASDRKYDPIWDVQVICAVNKKGELSRKILNERLQQILNPDGETVEKSPFRVGDKIVNGKNAWLKSADSYNDECNKDGQVYVANGEQARVIEVTSGVITARLTSPPRTVLIYRRAKSEQQEQAEEAAGGEDAQGEDTSDGAAEGKSTTGCQFELGYAQSCHKCVSPDTIVETADGLYPIREISSYGLIASPSGPAEYKNLVSYQNAECVQIETEDGHEITVSNDHKCEIWSGTDWIMVLATDIKSGQWVRQRLGATIDVQRLVTLPESYPNPKAQEVICPPVLTEQVAEFFGLMVADGTIYRGGIRLVKAQKETVQRFANLASVLFGINHPSIAFTDGKDTGWWTVEIGSTAIADWLRSVGGMCPRAKAIPSCVLRSSLQVQSGFLRGLFEDGSVHERDGRLDHIQWTTCSKAMMKIVRVMLLRFGIVSSTNSQCRRQLALYIYSSDAKRFQERIGFIANEKNRRLKFPQYGNGESSRKRVPINTDAFRTKNHRITIGISVYQNALHAGYVSRSTAEKFPELLGVNSDCMTWHYSRIRSTRSTSGPVMCVEVPTQGRFLQNGFPWSNCQGSQWKIVIVMLDTDNAARKVCSRQWIYTGISRAEIFCLMIGTKKTADAMCVRDALFSRKTFLKEQIDELKAAADEAEKLAIDVKPASESSPFDENTPDCVIDAYLGDDGFDFDDILEGVL